MGLGLGLHVRTVKLLERLRSASDVQPFDAASHELDARAPASPSPEALEELDRADVQSESEAHDFLRHSERSEETLCTPSRSFASLRMTFAFEWR